MTKQDPFRRKEEWVRLRQTSTNRVRPENRLRRLRFLGGVHPIPTSHWPRGPRKVRKLPVGRAGGLLPGRTRIWPPGRNRHTAGAQSVRQEGGLLSYDSCISVLPLLTVVFLSLFHATLSVWKERIYLSSFGVFRCSGAPCGQGTKVRTPEVLVVCGWNFGVILLGELRENRISWPGVIWAVHQSFGLLFQTPGEIMLLCSLEVWPGHVTCFGQ